jgi:hypothetical protein
MDEKQDIATLIDVCILNNTHFDIANVIHKILSGKFRYTGDTWEYLKTATTAASTSDAAAATAVWDTDVNSERFIYAIRTLVCGAFTRRSLYWVDTSIEKDERYTDTEVVSTKLLSISSKLKDNKYICVLIKECKQFFLYE